MLELIAQSTDLGKFEAPSSAFEFAVEESGAGAASTLERILSVGLGGITIAAGIYLLFVFIVAAFNWLSAGGDSGKVEKARDSMVNGLMGLVLIVAAYAIMGLIGSLFGLNILRLGDLLLELAPGSTP